MAADTDLDRPIVGAAQSSPEVPAPRWKLAALAALLLILVVQLFLMLRPASPEEQVRRAMEELHLSGATIAIGNVGETRPRLVTIDAEPDEFYRYYSLSKPITAALVLDQVSKGRLSLDQQIAGASVRQILQHRGGWDREMAGDPVLERSDHSPCTRLPPPTARQFEPGTRFVYSNIGYCLLGAAVERASGQAYPDLARAILPETRAMRYDPWLGPAGGWSGDAATYFRFAARPLPAMTAARPVGETATEYFGLGWKVHADGSLSHFGAYRTGDYALVLRQGTRITLALFHGNPPDYEGARDHLRGPLTALSDSID
ncbi:serine hydrolase domain-containing protein [Sphingopyxis sp. MWB1]|uniref:serine hydrolase domain-containing protein n=1 Tax=Sphingopyxis sp. MWB1 TaxID=1537715 RepID=UPI00051A58B7|nr:serine hydrolase domain-containing protein [Sphingopyxis sp. MWB1]